MTTETSSCSCHSSENEQGCETKQTTELPVMSTYTRLGGEEKLRELVERFYKYMDSLPEVKELRAMHGENLAHIKQVLFEFLSGWFGGPGLYEQNRGQPRLRVQHLPFAIDKNLRDQWLLCMFKAMHDMQIPEALQQDLQKAFYLTADHMRNQPETRDLSPEITEKLAKVALI